VHLERVALFIGQRVGITDDGIGQLQRGGFGGAELDFVAVGDLFDLSLVQPCRTGRVEAYIASVPTVGDPRVAQPGHLLDVRVDHAVLPEFRVQFEEPAHGVGNVAHDGTEIRGLAGYG
jgi:hypothetical protein